MPTLLSGRAPAGLWEGLAAQVEALGFTLHQVPDAASIGGANGLTDFSTRKVSVRADMDDAARVKTLRSEEHTSELPSLMRISYAVFFLKKKTTNMQKNS